MGDDVGSLRLCTATLRLLEQTRTVLRVFIGSATLLCHAMFSYLFVLIVALLYLIRSPLYSIYCVLFIHCLQYFPPANQNFAHVCTALGTQIR